MCCKDVLFSFLEENPKDVEAFAKGSVSITRTFFSRIPKAAHKLTQVVVLPTPPFWLQMEIILPILIGDY